MIRVWLPAGAFALSAALGTAVAIGCDGGSPSLPSLPLPEASGGGDAQAESAPEFAVCPPSIQPSFASIYSQILSTHSCGTDIAGNCHSHDGNTSTGNLLDFSLDAGAVYAELVNAPSKNIAGDAGGVVLRVAPGDAGASMLYIKLTLTTSADPRYGSGMPLTAPGSVCPATLFAVKAWIDDDAGNN